MRLPTLITIVTLVLAPRVYADKLKPEAQVHLDAALKAYEAKDYDVAFREFDQAYAVDPNPALLYATAQALRHASKCGPAIEMYRRYLDTRPNDTQVAAAKSGIATCEATIKTEPRSQPTPEPKPPPPAPAPAPPVAQAPAQPVPSSASWYKRDPLADGLVVGGAIGIGVGIVFLAKGSSSEHASQTAQFRDDFIHDLDDATSQRRIGAVALSLGAAMAVGGIVVFVVRDRHDAAPTIVGGSDGRTVYLAGTF